VGHLITTLFSLRKRGICFHRRWFVCLSVCLSVTTITKKIVDGFVPNFLWRFLGKKETSQYHGNSVKNHNYPELVCNNIYLGDWLYKYLSPPYCMLAASHAALWWVMVCMPTEQTDRRTTDHCITLSVRRSQNKNTQTHCPNGHFLDKPALASCRLNSLSLPIQNNVLGTNDIWFLQAGWHFCHPTNCIEAVQDSAHWKITDIVTQYYNLLPPSGSTRYWRNSDVGRNVGNVGPGLVGTRDERASSVTLVDAGDDLSVDALLNLGSTFPFS